MTATPMTARGPRKTQGGRFSATGDFAGLKARAERTMANLDRQPVYIRRLAHEYGWLAVSTLLRQGITKPTAIESTILTIRGYGTPSGIPICDQMKAERILNNSGWPYGTRPTPGDAA